MIRFPIPRAKSIGLIDFLYFQLGTHLRAKRKREELSNILLQMRKAQAQKTNV